MADYKVTLFFTEGAQGWSESYYQTANSPELVRPLALALVKARGGMLAGQVGIPYVRISDETIKGDSRVVTNPAFVPLTQFGAGEQIPDFAWTGLVVRMEATDLYRRSMTLRGVPDIGPQGPATAGPMPANLLAAFNVFRDILKNDSWQMRNKNRGLGFENKRVIFVKPDNALKRASFSVNAHGYQVGDKVNVTNLAQYPTLRGVRLIVAVVDANEFVIEYINDVQPLLEPYRGDAMVRKVGYVYPDIAETTFIRFGKRDTGRPFGQSRGRRSAQRRVAR